MPCTMEGHHHPGGPSLSLSPPRSGHWMMFLPAPDLTKVSRPEDQCQTKEAVQRPQALTGTRACRGNGMAPSSIAMLARLSDAKSRGIVVPGVTPPDEWIGWVGTQSGSRVRDATVTDARGPEVVPGGPTRLGPTSFRWPGSGMFARRRQVPALVGRRVLHERRKRPSIVSRPISVGSCFDGGASLH